MKNAIVFGATSGIGKSLTEILVKEGYRVAITGRRLPLLEALKKEFPNQILIKQNDIQEVQDVERI
jgi:short-subunit dehydrogenase